MICQNCGGREARGTWKHRVHLCADCQRTAIFKCPVCKKEEYIQSGSLDHLGGVAGRGWITSRTTGLSYCCLEHRMQECVCCGKRGRPLKNYTCSDCAGITHYAEHLPMTGLGKGRWLGVELEVVPNKGVSREMAARMVRELAPDGWCYTKHDGSIRDNASEAIEGFEIVSRPADLNHHLASWLWLTDAAPFIHVNEGCGLHVHVDRSKLGKVSVGQILAFLHDPENYVLVRYIAGRWNTRYASLAEDAKPTAVVPNTNNLLQRRGRRGVGTKYTGFNIIPEKTVEFRIFKPTIVPEELFTALEFCHSITSHFGPQRLSLREFNNRWRYLEFVGENAKRYPHLVGYLETGGYL